MRTVVTREVEWDDEERDVMLGLGIFEAGVGPCGFHHSLTSDPANHFDPEVETCLLCAGQAKSDRLLRESDRAWVATFGESGPSAGLTAPWDGRSTRWVMTRPDLGASPPEQPSDQQEQAE